jgi:hypothetical protein
MCDGQASVHHKSNPAGEGRKRLTPRTGSLIPKAKTNDNPDSANTQKAPKIERRHHKLASKPQ